MRQSRVPRIFAARRRATDRNQPIPPGECASNGRAVSKSGFIPDPYPAPGADPTPDALGCAVGTAAPPSALVAITDPDTLAGVTLRRVLDQMIQTGQPGTGWSALEFYSYWWGQAGSQCPPAINGQPNACNRAERALENVDPFTSPSSPNAYLPVAVFNRFDLAPSDGANCVEVRIVFGKRSGLTDPNDRNFAIFEPVMPNPQPSAGRAGCRALEDLWWNIAQASGAQRRALVESLLFTGAPATNVRAVVHTHNFTFTGGRLRTNTRMSANEPWALREWLIASACAGSVCAVYPVQRAVDKTPPGEFFATGGGGTPGATFRNQFSSRVAALAAPVPDHVVPSQLLAAISLTSADQDYAARLTCNTAFA